MPGILYSDNCAAFPISIEYHIVRLTVLYRLVTRSQRRPALFTWVTASTAAVICALKAWCKTQFGRRLVLLLPPAAPCPTAARRFHPPYTPNLAVLSPRRTFLPRMYLLVLASFMLPALYFTSKQILSYLGMSSTLFISCMASFFGAALSLLPATGAVPPADRRGAEALCERTVARAVPGSRSGMPLR